MKWNYLGLLIIGIVVLYFLLMKEPELLTNLTPDQRKIIADRIKGKTWWKYLVARSAEYNIPHERIAAIVAVESQGNNNAKGNAGEQGLMQLMTPAVKDVYAQWKSSYEVAVVTGLDLFNAEKNILIGTCYLAILKQRYGNLNEATKRYNGTDQTLTTKYLNEVKEFEPYFNY